MESLTRKLAVSTDVLKVLDIGAGRGSDLAIVKKNAPNSELIAIESYLPNVRRLKEMGYLVHTLNLEKDPFPFPDESIDYLIANQILEHCKEIFWILHEATRVLKVGGSIYVGVPNLASLHSRLLLLFGFQPTCIKNSICTYSRVHKVRFS